MQDDETVIFRTLTHADVVELIDVQEAGAVAGLSHIFPQDKYPFQRDVLMDRWHSEIDDPEVRAFAFVDADDQLVGFAATKRNELLHFGTACSYGDQELHNNCMSMSSTT